MNGSVHQEDITKLNVKQLRAEHQNTWAKVTECKETDKPLITLGVFFF